MLPDTVNISTVVMETGLLPSASSASFLNEVKAVIRYYQAALLAFGVSTNCLSFVVLSSRQFRHSSTAVYLRGLALMDIVAVTVLVRYVGIGFFSVDLREDDVQCHLAFYIQGASITCSSWVLIAVTLERVVSILWPHRVMTMCSRSIAKIVVVLLYLLCLVYTCFIFVLIGDRVSFNRATNTTSVLHCQGKTLHLHEVYNTISMTLVSVGPCIVLILLNCLILFGIIRSKRRLQKFRARETLDNTNKIYSVVPSARSTHRDDVGNGCSDLGPTAPQVICHVPESWEGEMQTASQDDAMFNSALSAGLDNSTSLSLDTSNGTGHHRQEFGVEEQRENGQGRSRDEHHPQEHGQVHQHEQLQRLRYHTSNNGKQTPPRLQADVNNCCTKTLDQNNGDTHGQRREHRRCQDKDSRPETKYASAHNGGHVHQISTVPNPSSDQNTNTRPVTKPTNTRTGNVSKQSSSKMISLTLTLLAINVTFLVCTSPLTIFNVTYIYLGLDSQTVVGVQTVLVSFSFTNNALNFFMYCITGSKFRTVLRSQFLALLRRNPRSNF